jgi:hypothetical protein
MLNDDFGSTTSKHRYFHPVPLARATAVQNLTSSDISISWYFDRVSPMNRLGLVSALSTFGSSHCHFSRPCPRRPMGISEMRSTHAALRLSDRSCPHFFLSAQSGDVIFVTPPQNRADYIVVIATQKRFSMRRNRSLTGNMGTVWLSTIWRDGALNHLLKSSLEQ